MFLLLFFIAFCFCQNSILLQVFNTLLKNIQLGYFVVKRLFDFNMNVMLHA